MNRPIEETMTKFSLTMGSSFLSFRTFVYASSA
ncbi:MAG: hypothetical protein KatS3mg042_0551 [Rhodothermaceae bacterium]|nr:MAG: hypothetical protein KatS3mg042_0551 [Rhodothermaceae bacterium]